jgi:hypothetical protein
MNGTHSGQMTDLNSAAPLLKSNRFSFAEHHIIKPRHPMEKASSQNKSNLTTPPHDDKQKDLSTPHLNRFNLLSKRFDFKSLSEEIPDKGCVRSNFFDTMDPIRSVSSHEDERVERRIEEHCLGFVTAWTRREGGDSGVGGGRTIDGGRSSERVGVILPPKKMKFEFEKSVKPKRKVKHSKQKQCAKHSLAVALSSLLLRRSAAGPLILAIRQRGGLDHIMADV